MVAVDSKGHAVTDLKREDFHIFDSGKLQLLRLFAPSGSGSAAPSAGSTPAAGQAEPMPPGYAMRLLDWLNTGYDERPRVRENVLRLLKSFKPRQKLGFIC